MLIIYLAFIAILVIASALLARALWGFFILSQGAFYAPSSDKRIKHILRLANIKPGDKVIDLGSGDGRVLIAAAEQGAIATGIELDPIYVRKSRQLINKSKHAERIKIIFASFWKHDLSDYDVLIIYGIGHIMKRLEKKILREAKKDARIISVYFPLPTLKVKKKQGDVSLYTIS